jgi:hypothetical protein
VLYVKELFGMMSEAELHTLRARLHHGKLNKARRGELFTCVPTGYVRPPEGGIIFDPDEQVRSVIALVFAKFAGLGSVPKVNAYFAAHGTRLGVRVSKGPDKGRLLWRPATRRALYEILRHPFGAGAHVYRRCPADPVAKAGGRSKSGRRPAPPEEWVCLLKDRVPAYISWEDYEQNQRRLHENDRGRGASRRPTGRAPTLLNGRLYHDQPRHLTAQGRERVAALAQDLPALWQAETTTGADRRAVVRQLIERVVLTGRGGGEDVEVVVRWRGGSESRHEVRQGLRRYDQLWDYEGLRVRVAALRGEGQTGEQTAGVLTREGYRTPRGGSFTGDRVRRLFMLFGLTGVPAGVRGSAGLPGPDE